MKTIKCKLYKDCRCLIGIINNTDGYCYIHHMARQAKKIGVRYEIVKNK